MVAPKHPPNEAAPRPRTAQAPTCILLRIRGRRLKWRCTNNFWHFDWGPTASRAGGRPHHATRPTHPFATTTLRARGSTAPFPGLCRHHCGACWKSRRPVLFMRRFIRTSAPRAATRPSAATAALCPATRARRRPAGGATDRRAATTMTPLHTGAGATVCGVVRQVPPRPSTTS